jgi:hypothetical protein
MNYIYIIEIILFSVIAIFLGNFLQNKTYKIINYIFWITIILVSLLLNYDKYLYSLSILLICVLILISYIKKNIILESKYSIIFWLLFCTTLITTMGIIISKKYIYNNMNSNAPRGDKGTTGNIGNSGESYFLETIPQKCYNEIINEIENYYREIKDTNNIDYDKNEYQFKNLYLKDNISRICTSKEFLHKIINSTKNECEMTYTGNTPDKRKCINSSKPCNSDYECNTNIDITSNYNTELKSIKEDIIYKEDSWIHLILANTCKENLNLKKKINIKPYESITNPTIISQNNKLLFNNSLGRKFLEDEFEIDKFWENKLNLKVKDDPFIKIKERPIWNLK